MAKKKIKIFFDIEISLYKNTLHNHIIPIDSLLKKKNRKKEKILEQTRRERLDQINHTYWRKKKFITKLIRKSNIQSSRQENPISEILPSQKKYATNKHKTQLLSQSALQAKSSAKRFQPITILSKKQTVGSRQLTQNLPLNVHRTQYL